MDWDFRFGPVSAPVAASTERTIPSVSSFILSGTLTEVILAAPLPSAAPSSCVWSLRLSCSETPPLLLQPPPLIGPAPAVGLSTT